MCIRDRIALSGAVTKHLLGAWINPWTIANTIAVTMLTIFLITFLIRECRYPTIDDLASQLALNPACNNEEKTQNHTPEPEPPRI